MKSKVAILLIIVFLFNGLRDARQLNDMSILSAIGIDIDENGEYIVTGWVDAMNSFGAEVREYFVVTYTATKDGYKNGAALFD